MRVDFFHLGGAQFSRELICSSLASLSFKLIMQTLIRSSPASAFTKLDYIGGKQAIRNYPLTHDRESHSHTHTHSMPPHLATAWITMKQISSSVWNAYTYNIQHTTYNRLTRLPGGYWKPTGRIDIFDTYFSIPS